MERGEPSGQTSEAKLGIDPMKGLSERTEVAEKLCVGRNPPMTMGHNSENPGDWMWGLAVGTVAVLIAELEPFSSCPGEPLGNN